MSAAIWMSLDVAAKTLGLSSEALKKRLQQAVKNAPDGSVESRPTPGIKARKLGRYWRVCLSEGWANDN